MKMKRNYVRGIYILFFCLLSYFSFSQTISDSTLQSAPDTNVIKTPPQAVTVDTSKVIELTPTPPPVISSTNASTEQKDENSYVAMHFIKQKVEHGPDSTFFNILSITNNNTSSIQGLVKITVPIGWKIVSESEINVNIQPGGTELIPIRVSLARTVIGGVSYLVNATLTSDRSLFSNKNQTFVSKACYVIVPEKKLWDMYPVNRNVYIDRYTQYAPLQLKLSNKGNGSEVIKLEFDIGSSLLMFGTLGNKHFTSVELRPHRDTIINFSVKYIPSDELSLWDRDFKKLTVRIIATVDSLVKKSSVSFKYLESSYYNFLPGKATPLNIEVQLQNLISNVNPRLLLAADGLIIRKNYDEINYNIRITSIPFSGYANADEFGNLIWRRSRFVVGYTSGDKWQIKAGDVNSSNVGFIGSFGRGVSGWYRLDEKNKFGGAVTASIFSPIYSASVYHTTRLPRNIFLGSSLSAIIDNYNRMNTYGAAAQVNYPFLPGHNIGLMLSGSLTQHNYNDQTFTAPNGSYIITNDPNATRIGIGSQMNYRLSKKRASASLSVLFATKNFFQYYSGKINMIGSGRYTINDRYYLVGTSNIVVQDPKRYNRGVLFPSNKFLSGTHKIEGAKIVSNHLTLFAGPVLDHLSYRALKIDNVLHDSTFTEFSTISPKLSFRCNYKNNPSGFISPYAYFGYTFVTAAIDSFFLNPTINPTKAFFNAKAGVNIMQKNWGVNVFYFYGPNNLISQSDNYYYGRYSKSLRIMPFFQRYYWNKKLLLSSYNSYFYEVLSNNERIALNARLSFFFERAWTMFVDNNLYLSSMINSENEKVYTRNFFLNLGVRKSFDIPQPGIKYYDIKVVCFKDINGNKVKDFNEHGLKDIAISIDRHMSVDTLTKRSVKQRGQFAPTEMVTDEFGQVMYYRIPQGDFDLGIYPLTNLIDIFNVNGQKQTVFINRDTTYYIPFVRSYKVAGKIILNRDEYSSLGGVSAGSVRITATDSSGNSYFGLTAPDGGYNLFVPASGEYDVSVNNIFGDQFVLQQSLYRVSFDGAKEFNVDFIFDEKKRQMNINGVTSSSGNISPATSPISNKDNVKSSLSPENTSISTQAVYRIQLVSTKTKVPKSQYATRFKGAENISESFVNGVYKYTAGEFSDNAKAQEYKQKLISLGYQGAFVVSVNGEKSPSSGYSITQEPAAQENTNRTTNSTLVYKVQIVSSKTKVPQSQYAIKFKGLEKIGEYVVDGDYKYTAGEFNDIAQAQEYKQKMVSLGYQGVFMVTFQDGKRIK